MIPRRTSSALALAAALVSVTGLLASPAQATGSRNDGVSLTTKTPYAPQQSLRGYQAPPAGFAPVYTENVSRHGARTLSDSDDGDALLALWKVARSKGALTGRGKNLGPEIQRLLAANAAVGYGSLTGSGKAELAHTADRMADRLPTLFAHAAGAARGGPRIAVLSSSQPRAIASANTYTAALAAAVPGLGATIAPDVTDDDLLYFHKAAINKPYQTYVKTDPRVAAAEKQADDDPRTASAARDILQRSFTPAFVDDVAAGVHSAQFADATSAAEAVYDLYTVTRDMTHEGTWHMDRYISAADAAWFGYLDDVTSFYENGPGFAGDDITYSMGRGAARRHVRDPRRQARRHDLTRCDPAVHPRRGGVPARGAAAAARQRAPAAGRHRVHLCRRRLPGRRGGADGRQHPVGPVPRRLHLPRADALRREADRVQGRLLTGGTGQLLLRPRRTRALLQPGRGA